MSDAKPKAASRCTWAEPRLSIVTLMNTKVSRTHDFDSMATSWESHQSMLLLLDDSFIILALVPLSLCDLSALATQTFCWNILLIVWRDTIHFFQYVVLYLPVHHLQFCLSASAWFKSRHFIRICYGIIPTQNCRKLSMRYAAIGGSKFTWKPRAKLKFHMHSHTWHLFAKASWFSKLLRWLPRSSPVGRLKRFVVSGLNIIRQT
jgi:hypothetical protein